MALFLKRNAHILPVPLGAMNPIMFAIDTSGSTGGDILRNEVMSAKMLRDFLRKKSSPAMSILAVEWNSNAKRVSSLEVITHSAGGTQPECIVPLIKADKPQLLALYTDGECDAKNFRAAMNEANARLPIIIVFTLKNELANNASTTVRQLYSQINMSVPEGVLATSNNVCIVINSAQSHKVLMSSGAFVSMFPARADINDDTRVAWLPDFDMNLLPRVQVVDAGSVPDGCILVGGFEEPLILDMLYNAPTTCEQVDATLLKALAARPLLPKYDLNRLHAMLMRHLNQDTAELNPEYQAALERLMRVAASSSKSAEARAAHVQARAEFDAIRSRLRGAVSATLREKRAAISHLLQVIADYRADANQFVLGSNRANRAQVIKDADVDEIRRALTTIGANMMQIAECPIFLQPGNACILLAEIPFASAASAAAPAAAAASAMAASSGAKGAAATLAKEVESTPASAPPLIERCTSDFGIDAPFHLGAKALAKITPGVYCADFALDCQQNPTTREPVIATIVLVKDIHSLMRQLCRVFCGSRQMWHMLFAFASLLAEHLRRDAWAEHAVLLPYLEWLVGACRTTADFKDDGMGFNEAGSSRVALLDAICNVVNNYSTLLRNRLPSDTRAMINLWQTCATLRPQNRVMMAERLPKVEGMIRVIETFGDVLRAYKAGKSMLPYIMQLDADYLHCAQPSSGLRALVAKILFDDGLQWNDDPTSRRGPKRYVNLALQDAIDLALRDAKAEPAYRALIDAFNGENVDAVTPVELPPLPADRVHFGPELYERTKIVHGEPCAVCAYCGFTRKMASEAGRHDMREHLKRSFTPQHFYNGTRCLKEAIAELGVGADERALFKSTKEKLYRKHGINFWALHTADCKATLLYFIGVAKFNAGLLPKKPSKF